MGRRWHSAREGAPGRSRGFGSGFQAGLLLSALALAATPGLVRVVRSWRFRAAVTGDSMLPDLHAGDWLLVDPEAFRRRSPRTGEVVVVPDPREPSRWLVKRVDALEQDGRVRLTGDNPKGSTDSRSFGPVERSTLIGRAWARYWPPQRLGTVR